MANTQLTQVLPRYIVIKSVYNNKYLQYGREVDKRWGYKLLDFTGEDVADPRVKFKVKKANARNGLVHLQCCYNSRYLARSGEEQYYIFAHADEPEEDQSKWSCTLFEPVYLDDNTVRFRHVQLGRYVCLLKITSTTGDQIDNNYVPHDSCRLSVVEGPTSLINARCDVFTIINKGLLTILPKYVAFKGNNGKYLDCGGVHGPFLEFRIADLGDPMVQFEIFTVGDGSIAIKSSCSGKFLYVLDGFGTVTSGWISASAPDYKAAAPFTLFWPFKVRENAIALRNIARDKFCRRYTVDIPQCEKRDYLFVDIDTTSEDTYLEVHELVLSRDIYDVIFHLEDAKIYNQEILTMATGGGDNDSKATNFADMKLSYEETRSSTWNSTISLTLGVKTTIETGIPFILEGKVEISAELTGSYEWGKTNTSTTTVEVVHKVTIPPMSSVKVNMLATKGSCNIPFSYTQCDTLTNGTQKIYDVDGGIYTCTNCYNFKYDTHQLPL